MVQIFWKRLTPTDVESRLAIPTEYWKHFGEVDPGQHSIEFTALDVEGNQWDFCLSTRTKGEYAKPVLNGRGWLAFVRAKSLQIGDGIIFLREADEGNGVIFKIHAGKIRANLQLFGKDTPAFK